MFDMYLHCICNFSRIFFFHKSVILYRFVSILCWSLLSPVRLRGLGKREKKNNGDNKEKERGREKKRRQKDFLKSVKKRVSYTDREREEIREIKEKYKERDRWREEERQR